MSICNGCGLEQNRPIRTEAQPVLEGCNVCGGAMVMIRGKHPQDNRRKVCPTCVVEKLEDLCGSLCEPVAEKDKIDNYMDDDGGFPH